MICGLLGEKLSHACVIRRCVELVGKENLYQIIDFIHSKNRLAMADISTFEEGIMNSDLGADILSTTLSGYTTYSETNSTEPDFELVKELTSTTDTPVILEGRIWLPDEVKKAFELGRI